MAWIDIKELAYPVIDDEGEIVAIFTSERVRDKFVEQYNAAITDESIATKLVRGDYVDFSTDIQVRAE